MNAPNFTLIFAISLWFSTSGHGDATAHFGISLSEAVAAFNKQSLSDPIGANQEPITEEEVIAAILLWERPPQAPISDELLASFKNIAATKALPSNASFESLTGYDRGGFHIFDVWSVRICIERTDGSSYAFVIRERAVGSRTISEELARIDRFIAGKEVAKWVGGYRILDRRKELAERIKNHANNPEKFLAMESLPIALVETESLPSYENPTRITPSLLCRDRLRSRKKGASLLQRPFWG